MSSAANPLRLAGAVAVVAGATRGAGRGIARALGEAGAMVYCTGRSMRGRPSPYNRPETIEETAESINAAGGHAVALRVDHTAEAEVAALFERVEHEQGRLDILVNSIAGEDPMMNWWVPFWEVNLTNAEALLRQALVSRVTTAKHAARLMTRRQRGFIAEVTENDLLLSSGDALSQFLRFSHKSLAAIYGAEMRKQGIVAVAITPGFMRSERVLEHFGVTEENWREAGKKDRNFLESESPLFVGRAIVALATDPAIAERSGQLFSSWEVARDYGLTDVDGRRPDWGRLEIDYSQIPLAMLESMKDAIEVQAAWLELLSKRTRSFQAAFLEQTAALM
jgi:NAD(P)-dependent dehydrogenase (short-subunit alcohol dehydrogenase family)